MRDNILIGYVLMDILFVVSGGLLIIFALMTEAETSQAPTVETVARNLLLMQCPLNAAIGNAVVVFVTFLMSVPAIVLPMTRGWLKVHGYMTVVCGFYTMILGLTIWFDTLKTRSKLHDVWISQSNATRSLIQQELKCCGYINSTAPFPDGFVQDSVCTNSLVAANLGGCVGPFSSFGNNFLDLVFTGAFGIVGVDVLLILATAILLKDRKEKARYRHIDEKNGAGAF